MFKLMTTYFNSMDRNDFEKDLKEKDWVVVLKDVLNGKIQGFSTFMLLNEMIIEGIRVKAIFSGDTIINFRYWGEKELFKIFGNFVFSLSQKYKQRKIKLFWFLISMGYKTYRLLPCFFKEFYPRYDKKTPHFEQKVLDTFACQKFPLEYENNTGLIHFDKPKECLKPGVADVGERRLKNPHIKFFCERNPLYMRGDELACITEFSEENLKLSACKVIFGDKTSILKEALYHV